MAPAQHKIVGRWNYAGVQPVGSEQWSQKLIEIMIGVNSFKQFCANNRYKVYENEQISYGSWEILGDKLITRSDDGEVRSFEIIKSSIDTMNILGKKKIYATLVRDRNAILVCPVDSAHEIASARVTTKQIAKKWVLNDIRPISTTTQEQKVVNQIVTNALRSSWYDFRPDGVAISKFNSQKTLQWHFEDNNRSIVIADELGDGSVWNIILISKSQLVLRKPHAKTQMIFESVQTEN